MKNCPIIPATVLAMMLAAMFSTMLSTMPVGAARADETLDHVTLPPGFHIETYAQVPNARSLTVAPELGVVFVGSRRTDAIHAIIDRDRDHRPEAVIKVLGGLKAPNGIVWHDGALYVAEQHRVVRYPVRDINALAHTTPQVLFDGLPDKSHHGWRFMDIGPDGNLYIAVGSPCNICAGTGIEGTIVRLDPRGGKPRIFARGIRNSVGFDFHPATGELFFTDNGADGMGDDVPVEELNHAPKPGLDFGFPYYGGGDSRTPAFRNRPPPADVVMPALTFPAHVAPLGVHFYRGTMFPAAYRGDAFVAHHGSWNRTVPDGYRLARVRFDGTGKPISWEPFAAGWLRDGVAWGRPVDAAELEDGSLLVSDDHLGVVYRITYDGH